MPASEPLLHLPPVALVLCYVAQLLQIFTAPPHNIISPHSVWTASLVLAMIFPKSNIFSFQFVLVICSVVLIFCDYCILYFFCFLGSQHVRC